MLKLYNTLTRKKQTFRPRKNKKVNLFVCGITSYDFSHIGHARTYVAFDMIAKYLKQKGYDISYVQNITDIDDKIINRAKREKISWKDLSHKFEREYLKDMKALNVNSVKKYAKATTHIKEIISQVKRLSEKGFAYRIKDGIYYDISKFKDYGKLSKRTALQAEDAVSRIDEAKDKRNKGDFCLWKLAPHRTSEASSGAGFEPSWPSPFGAGRPGWHIEDTAITEKYFSPQYDIHGGAKDLIFPHHEAEIAQMEAISGKKPMVKYWLHTGFLTVKKRKMAKSLGNFITIKDFLKDHSARILRLFVLKTHYRSPINYSEKEIEPVKKQLARIDEFVEKLKAPAFAPLASRAQSGRQTSNLLEKTKKDFNKHMEDDFNTPRALASVFQLVNKGNALINKNKLSSGDTKEILDFLKEIDQVFAFILKPRKKEKIPLKVLSLISQREKYRQEKNWKKADEIRKEIKKLGYQIEDTKQGLKIKACKNLQA